MIPIAIVLALAAAGLHATWNILLKIGGDPLRTSVRAVTCGVAIMSPIAAAAWLITGRPGFPPGVWLLAATSSLFELAYFVLLSEAYRRGDLSVIYPLARGTAPLLAVAAGVAILGERPSPLELVGVLLLLAGIWAVRKPASAGRATMPALLTGVCIATYTAIDKAGTVQAPPWLYGWVLGLFTALSLLLWSALTHRYALHDRLGLEAIDRHPDAPSLRQSALVGILMVTSYVLILFALSIAPLVVVAPVRESAIVLVAVWGIWRLRERERAGLRISGALGIVAGLVILVVR